VQGLALVTQYMFLITMLGMGAATAYFWLERDSLTPEFRPAATVSGIYTGIAAIMYFKMQLLVGTSGNIQTLLDFPTHYRYVDWVITTPLMLLNLTILLQLTSERRGLIFIMLGADLAMIMFGYFGELYSNIPGKDFEAWTLFGMGSLAWLLLLYIIYDILGNAAKGKVAPVKKAFETMRLFITFGWAIYPLGFVIGMISHDPAAKLLRELVYNFSDLVNKIGLGLTAVFAAKQIIKDSAIRAAIRKI
jgi:sensory rhodopsin